MPDQLLLEFRERAEAAVGPVDPGSLWEEGRRVRRRRQAAPVLAVLAAAAIGIGVLASGGGPSELVPAPPPATSTSGPTASPLAFDAGPDRGVLAPGPYVLTDIHVRGEYDVSVDIVGDGWSHWPHGAYQSRAGGTVSWGVQPYRDTIIDQCNELTRATTMAGAIAQLYSIQGTVTKPPTEASRLGLTGTHLRLEIPGKVTCTNGVDPTGGNLMAIWDEEWPDPTVTVDVWLLDADGTLLLLTRAVRGNPSEEMRAELRATFASLEFLG